MSYFLDECKNNPNLIRQTDDSGNVYNILIAGRGTDLFFQENSRSLFCVIDVVEGILFVQSIKLWEESNIKIGKDERMRIAKLIQDVYARSYKRELKLDEH